MHNSIYNIVIVSNEGYIQHATVMLTSLFCTNKEKSFVVYLFLTLTMRHPFHEQG